MLNIAGLNLAQFPALRKLETHNFLVHIYGTSSSLQVLTTDLAPNRPTTQPRMFTLPRIRRLFLDLYYEPKDGRDRVSPGYKLNASCIPPG